jgi:GT2 family glycosyltransferase
MTWLKSANVSIGNAALAIRVQSILFNTPQQTVERTLEYFENAARLARDAGIARHVDVALGDCSPQCSVDAATVAHFRRRYTGLDAIDYVYFNANLGHGGGQNRLMQGAEGDVLLIANPDILVAPRLFIELIDALSRPDVGIAEARQLPIEHPRYYDPLIGETSWASMACAMIPINLFRQLGGFDAETFFMYCDDVDFSWRARLAGFKVAHRPDAVAFHDKRLTNDGGWISSAAERYYSAEAGLLLPFKYSRPDLTDKYLEIFDASEDEHLIKAAGAFRLRAETGRLPTPIDLDHTVAEFLDGGYARTRYKPR